MHKTNIPHQITQEVFESASNAAEKGLSQFFTPGPLGQYLSLSLPKERPVITDFNCGNYQLLQAATNATSRFLLGSDIFPAPLGESSTRLTQQTISYDLTLLYPLLCEVDWRADLFVLNPPWRLFWHRQRLADLKDSPLLSVRKAFAALEPTAPRTGIDSTIATLLMALDRCTSAGEGFLIANNNTLERLLFAPDAPHADVAQHVWARVIIPGNPMTGLVDCKWMKVDSSDPQPSTNNPQPFATGVIYFAREHTVGVQQVLTWPDASAPDPKSMSNAAIAARQNHPLPDRWKRLGLAVASPYDTSAETYPRWVVVKERVEELQSQVLKRPWQLWLDETGFIRTGLSSFEHHSKKLNKASADRLFKLNGQSPMQLVLQRADRDELLYVAEKMGWRVQPELIAAVHDCVKRYHAARAPLYPLAEIQRLGYCDEQDFLVCKKDLLVDSSKLMVDRPKTKNPQPSTKNHQLVFRKGKRYPLRTQTVEVTHQITRPNATTGDLETCEYTGHDLGIFLHEDEFTEGAKPEEGREYSFMDSKLKGDPTAKVRECRSQKGAQLPECKIDFTLQQLVEHFEIPEVPDVATVNPQRYHQHLAELERLEQVLAQLAA